MNTNLHRSAKTAGSVALLLALASCSTPASKTSPSSATAAESPKSAAVAAQTGNDLAFVGKMKVQKKILKNGLTIVVLRDDSSPTFAYQTWFKVGSRNEIVNFTGLAHFFEHMMFRGTAKYPDGKFDRVMERAGSEGTNAFTAWDYTAYVEELPSDSLETAMELESDRMVNLGVDETKFNTEREVVKNERRYRTENDPEGTMFEAMFDMAFTTHPYHWPVIGYEEDLNRMTVKDAEAFYKKWYHPSSATVVIAGSVDPARVFSLADKYYGSLPAETPPPFTPPAEPVQTSARRKKVPLNVQVEKLMVGYRIPELTHPDYPALSMLRAVLAQGRSSRLHRALVNTGIATSAEAWDMENHDPSLMVFTVTLQKGKKASSAETVIARELARVSKELAGPKELERARNQTNFDFYSSLASNPGLAHFLGRTETVFPGGFQEALTRKDQMLKISAEELQRVARIYLQPAGKTVIYGVPK